MKKKAIIAGMVLALSVPSYSGIPVIDPSHIATSINNFINEYKQQSQIFQQGTQQLQNLKKLQDETSKYYNKLQQVSGALSKYRKYKESADLALEIINLATRGKQIFMNVKFSNVERKLYNEQYNLIINQVGDLTKDITSIVTRSGGYEMNDAERMNKVDALHRDLLTLRDSMKKLNSQVRSDLHARTQNETLRNSHQRITGRKIPVSW